MDVKGFDTGNRVELVTMSSPRYTTTREHPSYICRIFLTWILRSLLFFWLIQIASTQTIRVPRQGRRKRNIDQQFLV
jgi:hypothetical protein